MIRSPPLSPRDLVSSPRSSRSNSASGQVQSMQRRPSQRQMLEIAFEGKLDGRPIDDDDNALALEAELVQSPRISASHGHDHRVSSRGYEPEEHTQYQQQQQQHRHAPRSARAALSGRQAAASASSNDLWQQRQYPYSHPLDYSDGSGHSNGNSNANGNGNIDYSMVPTTPSSYSMASAHHIPIEQDDSPVVEPGVFQEGVLYHARQLGIDPEAEANLLWIARDSLVAPLPYGWMNATASDTGMPYYYNTETGESRWDHPYDDQYRQYAEDMRQRGSVSFSGTGEAEGGEDTLEQRFSGSNSSGIHTASYYERHPQYHPETATAWQDQYDHSSAPSIGYQASHHDDQYESLDPATVAAREPQRGHHHHQQQQHQACEDEQPVADAQSTIVANSRPHFVRASGDAEVDALHAKIQELETTQKEMTTQHRRDTTQISKLDKDVELLLTKLVDKEHADNAIQEKKQLEQTLGEVQSALETAQQDTLTLRDANEKLQRELAGAAAAMALQQQQQQQAADAVAVAVGGSDRQEEQEELRHHREQVATLQQTVAQERCYREMLEQDHAQAQERIVVATTSLIAARAEITKLEADLSRRDAEKEDHADALGAMAVNATSAISAAEAKLDAMTVQLDEKEAAYQQSQQSLAAVRNELEVAKQLHTKTLASGHVALDSQLHAHKTEMEALKKELETSQAAHQAATQEKVALAASLDQQTKSASTQQAEAEETQRTLKRELRVLERDLKALQSSAKEREEEVVVTKKVLLSMEQKLKDQDLIVTAATKKGYEDAEKVAAESIRHLQAEKTRLSDLYTNELQSRRQLHNRLMELQGNIRVFCRVRPIQAVERNSDQSGIAVFFKENDPESLDLVVGGGELGSDGKLVNGVGQKHAFEFDHVFQPTSTQEQVFAQTKALVTSALDGFNVCIFAYGQTGSGKTHTMEGTSSDRGVNFRSLQELFKIREERCATGNFECLMKLSILEVYNESVIDLMDKVPVSATTLDQRKALEIRLGKTGVYVDGLIEFDVFNENDVSEALQIANSHRTVGAHDVNEHSSRSHLVLSISIETIQKMENNTAGSSKKRFSKLHLIDLAGSERVGKTAASGIRLKEAQNINRSLSALGDVIAALGANSKHVPYRNSKLTYLLQESLSGNSKVLMFVNVSPVQWNAWETLCSLNFASRCRNVALGLAKSNGPTTANGSGSSGAAASVGKGKETSSGSAASSNTKLVAGPSVRAAPSPSGKGAQRLVYG